MKNSVNYEKIKCSDMGRILTRFFVLTDIQLSSA